MLIILYGTSGQMGYESRCYIESQGLSQVKKLSYCEGESVMVPRTGKRNYVTKEEVLNCDFVYYHTDNIIGFNKDQIIDAVTGRKDCLLSTSSYSVEYIQQLKMAYGDYVTVIFVYTDQYLLKNMTAAMPDMTDQEMNMRLLMGESLRKIFLEHRNLFDEVVLYGGEDSIYNTPALFTQYDHIIKKARKRQTFLNNRNYVEMPYAGPDDYIFVSYSHKDRDKVYPILAMLQQNGFRIWYDEGIKGGTNWRRVLTDKIEKCTDFLLFCSENSTKSSEVEIEIDTAIDCGKNIITVRLDKATYDRVYEIRLKKNQNVFYLDDSFKERLKNSFTPTVNTSK